MNRSTLPKSFFYQGSKLHNVISSNVNSIFQYQYHALAISTSAQSTRLLASDKNSSPLAEQIVGKQHARRYLTYGHFPAVGDSSELVGFNGVPLDFFAAIYLLGNGKRAFNPTLMRFLSPDKLSPFGAGDINVYMYCSGDPINYQDPSGLAGVATVFANFLNGKKWLPCWPGRRNKHPITVFESGPGVLDIPRRKALRKQELSMASDAEFKAMKPTSELPGPEVSRDIMTRKHYASEEYNELNSTIGEHLSYTAEAKSRGDDSLEISNMARAANLFKYDMMEFEAKLIRNAPSNMRGANKHRPPVQKFF